MATSFKDDPDWPDVAALQDGEEAALDRLMQRHHAGVTAFLTRMIGNRSDAEELAQETFVRAFFRIHQYRPRSPFIAWLYRIARNLCLDYFRSKAWKHKIQNEPLGVHLEEAPANELNDMAGQVRSAIATLPLKLREPLILTALEGLSHEEAGRRLGISPKAIEVKCYRARTALRKILK